MALLKHEFFEVVKIAKSHNYKSLCMIGKQNVILSLENCLSLSDSLRLEYDEDIIRSSYKNGSFDSEILFKAYGIEEVHSVDYSDYEGADIIFDLNEAELPEEYRNRFDLVVNGGTLEHVYNITHAMDNINHLVAPNGTVLHISPCSGWVDHGFYSISPTFYKDYYENNSKVFELKKVYLEVKKEKGPRQGDVILSPDCRELDDVCSYIIPFATNEIMIICEAVRKNSDMLNKSFPIQGMYSNMYSEYQSTGEAIHKDYEEISELLRNQAEGTVGIYGAGHFGRLFIKYCLEKDLESKITTIFDKDVEKVGKTLGNIEISYPKKKSLDKTECIIVAVKDPSEKIANMIRDIGYSGEIYYVL